MSGPPQYTFFVDGMMCQKKCASNVQRSLELVPGVTSCRVTFNNKTAEVWTTDSYNRAFEDDLRDAVSSVGFRVLAMPSQVMAKAESKLDRSADLLNENGEFNQPDLELTVSSGMHCGKKCPDRVKNVVESIDGVVSASVHYPSKKLSVWGFVSKQEVIESLTSHGYGVAESSLTKPSPAAETEVCTSETTAPLESANEDAVFLELKISGMSCTNCVKAIEKALKAVPGIDSIKIALLAEKAEIVFDGAVLTSEAIVQAVEGLGYHAQPVSSRAMSEPISNSYLFTVAGMSCTSCVNKIERSLGGLPGVQLAKVSLLANKLLVKIRDSSTTHTSRKPSLFGRDLGPRDVIDHLASLGYQANLVRVVNETVPDAVSAEVDALLAEEGLDQGEAYQSTELQVWARLLKIATFFGLPLMFLHLFASSIAALKEVLMLPAPVCTDSISRGQLLMFALTTPLQLVVGYKFYRSAYYGARHCSFGMDFLISLGTTVTYAYSVLSIIIGCQQHTLVKHLFFEASGMLFLFVTFGKYLEAFAKGQTVSAISGLLKLQPQEV